MDAAPTRWSSQERIDNVPPVKGWRGGATVGAADGALQSFCKFSIVDDVTCRDREARWRSQLLHEQLVRRRPEPKSVAFTTLVDQLSEPTRV